MHPQGHQYLLRLVQVVDPTLKDHPQVAPGTDSGPRQPPTPPPSGVSEPPEALHDQAKIKYWRDRAIQAEARLADRDRQVQKHLGPELEGQGSCGLDAVVGNPPL